MGQRVYHGDPNATGARRSTVVGAREALASLPGLTRSIWDAADRLFPVRITRSFWSRAQAADPSDPVLRQVLPDPRETQSDPHDHADPVGDALKSPVPWVVRKHDDRILVLLTKRCHLYCRYCFRRNHKPGDREDPTPQEWSAVLDEVRASGAQEVILSGGDPLAVSDERLLDAVDAFRAMVPVVRIHTRAPITLPSRITPELARALGARDGVWVLVHANHPRELSPDVDEALGRLVGAGVPVLNQAVLLRGVNDNIETLVALCQALVRRRVYPYYLHHPDAAAGNAHFRIDLDEGLQLYTELERRVSGIALPKYVIDPPDGRGKIPVRSWRELNRPAAVSPPPDTPHR